MNIGILIPGFSSDENDWSIPVQQHLARILSQSDDVRIIALRYPHTRTTYQVYDAQVYPLGYTHRARGLKRMALWLDTLRTVRRLHRERPFDVLHAMWADETGLLAVCAGRWLNVPSVVSIVGGELVGFPELNYGLQRSVFSHWVVGQALKANCVIAASEYALRLIQQAGYDVPAERVRVVPLGVDVGMFSPLTPQPLLPRKAGVPTSRGEGEVRLIHVASLVPIKDQAMLLRALARLDENMALDILGTGGEERKLRGLADELCISRRVNFMGAVGHTELPEYYRRAALHVITSQHEGQALVTVEAAACGVPTVGTDVGLLADAPEFGIAVPIGDDEALAVAIQGLLNDDERRVALGHSARAAVEREYTIERTAERYRELYNTLG